MSARSDLKHTIGEAQNPASPRHRMDVSIGQPGVVSSSEIPPGSWKERSPVSRNSPAITRVALYLNRESFDCNPNILYPAQLRLLPSLSTDLQRYLQLCCWRRTAGTATSIRWRLDYHDFRKPMVPSSIVFSDVLSPGSHVRHSPCQQYCCVDCRPPGQGAPCPALLE